VGGDVFYALAVDLTDAGKVYVATPLLGVIRTVDGGATWTPASVGLPLSHVRSLVLMPGATNTILAGTDGGGVYLSTTAGQ
jgi:hypothetical protein